MFIEVLETPNPKTLKFLLADTIIKDGSSYSFTSAKDAKVSPLAEKLFTIEHLKSVYISGDFVSVSVDEMENWMLVQPKVLSYITEILSNNIDIINFDLLEKQKTTQNSSESSDDEKKVVAEILELFEERIRPAVAMDGGDIVFREFKDGVVYISMHGACSGCPSSDITLKNGIENMLKYYVPAVQCVINIDEL